ncbi:hypothetical protein SAMN02745121_02531 [Nannocystis exedens]|uniref:Uncharacterized protein n=1 Tax=Nannocystis exedens TaxID=54 RepID=A0A1I1WTU4_9BACT|nr:hypothetical protein [Nannocystis exedens]PCC71002.1 hypothetical protein NAEX_04068 [Nannocystis exedens]SFD98625.1 hypothetical protein SAMN02745121_02531 [Nannocystis exedens]
MSPPQLAEALAAANELLRAHPLAAARVVATGGDSLVLEVHHCEWPPPSLPPFGRLCFAEPTYVQMPLHLEWGTTLQLFTGDVARHLPSLAPAALAGLHVFMLRAHDDSSPPAFIVAAGLRVEPTR